MVGTALLFFVVGGIGYFGHGDLIPESIPTWIPMVILFSGGPFLVLIILPTDDLALRLLCGLGVFGPARIAWALRPSLRH